MIQTIQNYALNTSAKTITLTDFALLIQERLKLIVDTTTNTVIYNFADPSVSQCTVSTNVISLSALPSSVQNGHQLSISYDTISTDPRADTMGVSLDTAINQAFDSMLVYNRGTNYINATSSKAALGAPGKLVSIFVSSASATPTIKLYDSLTATGTTLINTFTPVAGTAYTFPHVRAQTGIYIAISGTVDCMVFFDPTTT